MEINYKALNEDFFKDIEDIEDEEIEGEKSLKDYNFYFQIDFTIAMDQVNYQTCHDKVNFRKFGENKVRQIFDNMSFIKNYKITKELALLRWADERVIGDDIIEDFQDANKDMEKFQKDLGRGRDLFMFRHRVYFDVNNGDIDCKSAIRDLVLLCRFVDNFCKYAGSIMGDGFVKEHLGCHDKDHMYVASIGAPAISVYQGFIIDCLTRFGFDEEEDWHEYNNVGKIPFSKQKEYMRELVIQEFSKGK